LSAGDTITDVLENDIPGFSPYPNFRKSENIEDRRHDPAVPVGKDEESGFDLSDYGPIPAETDLSRAAGTGALKPRPPIPDLRRRFE